MRIPERTDGAGRAKDAASLAARRKALVAQIARERVAFGYALGEVAPLLRFGDRAVALAVSLRSEPMAIGAAYLGRALLWNTRAARWWRRLARFSGAAGSLRACSRAYRRRTDRTAR